jgi:hypothetical protein
MGMGGGGMGGGGPGRGMMNMSQGGGMGGGGGQDPQAQNVPPLGGKGAGMGMGGRGGLGMRSAGGGLPDLAAMSGSNRFAAPPMGGGAGAGGKGGAQDAPLSHQHATERARANTEAIKATHSIIKHLIRQSGSQAGFPSGTGEAGPYPPGGVPPEEWPY